jgi:hypothetical protein
LLTQFTQYKSFSEMARGAKPDSVLGRLARKLAKKMSAEFDRRLKEGAGLYRPWDDREKGE